METDIRIACVIFNSIFGKTDSNLQRMVPFIKEASEKGASLICFPEMNITGYCSDGTINTYALSGSGKVVETLKKLSTQYSITILAGMAEKESDGAIYATHLVIFPDGNTDKYRKLHIAPPENGTFTPGDSIPVFKTGDFTFGIQLCYDAHFPELSTHMAEQGVDAIFIPHASPRGSSEDKFRSWMRHIPARSYDNSIFVIVCNQTGANGNGLEFPGVAFVTAPSGDIISKYTSGTEGLMIADLKKENLVAVRSHKMKYFLPNRRHTLFPL